MGLPRIFVFIGILFAASFARAGDAAYDAELTAYRYPFEVQRHGFKAQQQALQMSFMDLKSPRPDAPVIVLLHGKNFGGYAFDGTAKRLHAMGYRVIMPDQIGFGKSTKPEHFQYSLQALASMTDGLLERLGVSTYTLLGHSMGGMLAARMALMYPDKVSRLILVAPLGLEDWRLLTPYKPVDEVYRQELKTTPGSIKRYQSDAYYSGTWKAEYDRLIQASSGWTRHRDFPRIAWNAALTFDMIFTQPVLYELGSLKVPTALIIGLNDRTAPGKAWAPEANQKKMGLYPELGRRAAKLIPRSRLFELAGVGHVPFVEDLDLFFDRGLSPALSYDADRHQ